MNQQRKNIFFVAFYLALFIIVIRLFYWQVIMSRQLKEEGESQTLRKLESKGLRGQIFTSDGYLLVGNKQVFDLKLDKKNFKGDPAFLAYKLGEIVSFDDQYKDASDSALKKEIAKQAELEILGKFSSRGNWPKLVENLSEESKQKIEALNNEYLYFDQDHERFYPEASMAAHLTGFVGRDEKNKWVTLTQEQMDFIKNEFQGEY